MISPTTININDVMHDYVVGATGLAGDHVLFAQNNAPSPNDQYASINLITSAKIGESATKYGNNAAVELSDFTLRDHAYAVFSVQVLRGDAMQTARALKSYHNTPAGQLLLEQLGVTFKRVSEIRNIAAVFGGRFEDRVGLDFEFYYDETVTQTVNSLASVEIDINVSAESDINETLEVNDDG